jgi:hypothetical protein
VLPGCAIGVAKGRMGCCGGRRPAKVLEDFGSRLVFGVEAALSIVKASLARVLAGALLPVSRVYLGTWRRRSEARAQMKRQQHAL